MKRRRANQIVALLKSIETGDPGPVAVVDQTRYIQHNPQTHEGSEGLEALFKRLSRTNPRVTALRAFEDGDYVFAHMEYDFSALKICFEVFRFEGERAVEHWDNIQPIAAANRSGHTMVDGPVDARDLDQTEANRQIIRDFAETVLIPANASRLSRFINTKTFVEHNPFLSDDLGQLRAALSADAGVQPALRYDRLHRVLAEGNFVLSVCEGRLNGAHSAFYDLFRLDDGLIAEHWDTTETVAPKSQWKNENGKF